MAALGAGCSSIDSTYITCGCCSETRWNELVSDAPAARASPCHNKRKDIVGIEGNCPRRCLLSGVCMETMLVSTSAQYLYRHCTYILSRAVITRRVQASDFDICSARSCKDSHQAAMGELGDRQDPSGGIMYNQHAALLVLVAGRILIL